ncbi:glycosyltransferase [Salisaeta longa]|uniref:glycosyltransferase n=1 Tax=Salisaeta longa TaxID=503170 RepID=UPI000408F2A7|nr:glycosyltransferase [Salisaeta longa]
MHVLLVPSWYPTAELPHDGLYFVDQAQALQRAGHRVGVVYPEQQSLRRWTPAAFYRHHFQTVVRVEEGLPTVRYHGWNVWWRYDRRHDVRIAHARRLARRYVRRFGRPDVLHAHSARWAAAAAADIGARLEVPHVVTEHFTKFLPSAHVSKRAAARAAYGLQTAAQAFAVSSALRDAIVARGWVAPEAVDVLPNMVDTSFFTRPPTPRPSGPFTFFALGHLHERKGMHDLLDAFARAFGTRRDTRLVIGGDGPEAQALKAQARRLGIEHHVAFPGALTRGAVRDGLWRAHAFVLPSHSETFGVVLIEALATGMPVIATTCGGPEDIVTDANGLLVPPQQPEALAAALQEMRTTAASYDPAAIRRAAADTYGASAIARRLTDCYRRVSTAS